MHHRLILKVTKFQLPPPERMSTVAKNIFWRALWPPMSNRIKPDLIFSLLTTFSVYKLFSK